MAFGWPDKNKPNPDPAQVSDPPAAGGPPEKTPAELIADSLKPLADQMTLLNTRFQTLEDNAVRRPERQDDAPPERLSVLDNEDAAFAQRLTPLVIRQLETESRMVLQDVKREYDREGYGELWAQYEGDINKVVSGSPLVDTNGKIVRGDPDYIRNCVDMVFGREARKAGMQFGGKGKGFFLESGSNGGGDNGEAPQNDGFTAEQRKVFQRMRVPLDDAKKVMGKLKFLGT